MSLGADSDTYPDDDLWDNEDFLENIFAQRDTEGDEDASAESDSEEEDSGGSPVHTQCIEVEEGPGPAIQMQRTQDLYEKQKGQSLAGPIKQVLDAMADVGIDVPMFLGGLCWGDANCISDAKIRYARSSLVHSKELPGILRRLRVPPRAPGSKDKRGKGAKAVIDSFAVECCQERMEEEMERISELMSSPAGEDIKEETLVGTKFEEMIEEMKSERGAPNIWAMIRQLAYRPKQEKRNTNKNPDKVRISYRRLILLLPCQTLLDRSGDHRNAILHPFAPTVSFSEDVCNLSQIPWTLSQRV